MKKKIKLAILGCGAIGSGLAGFVDKKLYKKVNISCVYDKDEKKANILKRKIKKCKPMKARTLLQLVKNSDIVLEAASWKIVKTLLKVAIRYKKDVIILSIGGLLKTKSLLRKAQEKNVKIYLPSGAISGIDGILASSKAKIKKCLLTTSKPVSGFKNIPYLQKKKINLSKINKETVVFKGSPQEAYKHFPQNINVASTLLFASGFKNTQVCIKINPRIKRNMHEIFLESAAGIIYSKVENLPSKANPKTSLLAIVSTKALLEKIFANIKVGT